MLRAGWLWSGSLAAALGPELTLPQPCPAGSEGAALLSELPAPLAHLLRAGQLVCTWEDPLGERHWPVPPARRSEPASCPSPHVGAGALQAELQSVGHSALLSRGLFPAATTRASRGHLPGAKWPSQGHSLYGPWCHFGRPQPGRPGSCDSQGLTGWGLPRGRPDETEGELGPGRRKDCLFLSSSHVPVSCSCLCSSLDSAANSSGPEAAAETEQTSTHTAVEGGGWGSGLRPLGRLSAVGDMLTTLQLPGPLLRACGSWDQESSVSCARLAAPAPSSTRGGGPGCCQGPGHPSASL